VFIDVFGTLIFKIVPNSYLKTRKPQPIDKSFGYMEFEAQKEAMYGILYMREVHEVDLYKTIIKTDDIDDMGTYYFGRGIITLRRDLPAEEVFKTIVHELFHALDDQYGIISDEIIDDAKILLGYDGKKNEKKFEKMLLSFMLKDYAKDNKEILAYSMESYIVNDLKKKQKSL
jgi:hypothetical protein